MGNRAIILGVGLILLFFFITSCLDDGGNEIMLTSQPAVVKLVPEKVLLIKGGDLIHSAEMESNPNLEEGDCGLVDFVLDYSDAENINTADSGYYTASDVQFTSMDKNPLETILPDTGKVNAKEVVITDMYDKSVLLDYNLFLFTNHTIEFSLDSINLSYNGEDSQPVVSSAGQRVYNFYLRYLGDTISTQKEIKYNVFDLTSFVAEKTNEEREAGKDSLYFRINYISAIKTDSTASWSTSQNFGVSLPRN
ncbi:hypothetical protein [Massilibacteroides sp.]|uniref:hypothetical protein n=1 Tax=Massilibacteroides sp. TaxID=2034766 RepID=UPI00261EBCC0|nr:hypothetical protein [Massilibacteroides sp.]MDD4515101.1 hypothetical protein [Massilibacteroides sp.]